MSNALTGIGGAGQIAAGLAACATGAGCVIGIPLIVLGVSNIGESVTAFMSPTGDGFNLTQAAIQEAFDFSDQHAVAANAVLNLTADLAGLNVLAVPKYLAKMTPRYSSDFRAVRWSITPAGLAINGATTTSTAANAILSQDE
ncbi:hypothetical protein [Microbulbifer pacificus]|uniref:hypothetical protein n=1 Tax=Microbulbifer pacificus TaxID=407164 RepID=UPI001319CBDF|nr:hypothetical protein [Microbulbifer pacificus]